MSAAATLPEVTRSPNLGPNVLAATAGALIMGADYRGLGVVRSLGRRGIPVWVIKQGAHLVAPTSRYGARHASCPRKDESRQIELLINLAARQNVNGWALLSTGDHSIPL